MRQYVIPNLPNYTLRDATSDYDAADLQGKRDALASKVIEELTFFFGADCPANAVIREKGLLPFMWVMGSDDNQEDIKRIFHVDDHTAQGIRHILNLADIMAPKKVGSQYLLRTARDVVLAVEDLPYKEREEVVVLLVDNAQLIFHRELISIGGIDGATLNPSDVIVPAIQRNAPAFVLVHNHPSGDHTPSQVDLDFTSRVKEAATLMKKAFLDHVIVSANGMSSCLDVLESKSVDKVE
jgi:DNA repair protein RadC